MIPNVNSKLYRQDLSGNARSATTAVLCRIGLFHGTSGSCLFQHILRNTARAIYMRCPLPCLNVTMLCITTLPIYTAYHHTLYCVGVRAVPSLCSVSRNTSPLLTHACSVGAPSSPHFLDAQSPLITSRHNFFRQFQKVHSKIFGPIALMASSWFNT